VALILLVQQEERSGVAVSALLAANIATETSIQQQVPQGLLGRVFGLVGTAAFCGQYARVRPRRRCSRHLVPRAVMLFSGAGVLVVTTAVWWMLRETER
jgi:hypothetical protein